MAVFQKASLTTYGLHRVAEAHKNIKMVFTAIGLGDGTIAGNLSQATALAHEKQRFPISASNVSGDTFWAECEPSNITDPNGIYVREMGLYIADPEHENERSFDKLYSVTSVIPDYGVGPDYYAFVPQNPLDTIINYKFALHTIISHDAQIVINIAGSGDNPDVVIATEEEPGIVRSNNAYGNVSVDPVTGVMQTNGLVEKISELEAAVETIPPGKESVEYFENGTFTVPERVTEIKVTACGAGGGGAASPDADSPGGGGGGGAAAILRKSYPVTPGQVLAIQIGVRGVAGTVDGTLDGLAGGYTVVGNLVTLPGGGGGQAYDPQTTEPSRGGISGGVGGGRGGAGDGTGAFGISGVAGGGGVGSGDDSVCGGGGSLGGGGGGANLAGGGSAFGKGGSVSANGDTLAGGVSYGGGSGGGPGAGGGGSCKGGTTAQRNGGQGGGGYVLIEYQPNPVDI